MYVGRGVTVMRQHQDLEKVRLEIAAQLGPTSQWKVPDGYPDGLGLCVIDAIWSLGVSYQTHVVPVVTRYREYRAGEGGDADTDGLIELLATYAAVGGDDEFADRIGTRHRTSTHPGAPLKATAVRMAAELLSAPPHRIDTMTMFHNANSVTRTAVKRAWRTLPGQRSSSIGWRYLLMLVGEDEVKADRMIKRFVTRAVNTASVSDEVAGQLVEEAAAALGMPVRKLDYAIWSHESRVARARRSARRQSTP
jgi:hypothetical protein